MQLESDSTTSHESRVPIAGDYDSHSQDCPVPTTWITGRTGPPVLHSVSNDSNSIWLRVIRSVLDDRVTGPLFDLLERGEPCIIQLPYL